MVFKDVSCDHSFLTRSTAASKETVKWTDGKEYPLLKIEISDKSHPFYTGKMKLVLEMWISKAFSQMINVYDWVKRQWRRFRKWRKLRRAKKNCQDYIYPLY